MTTTTTTSTTISASPDVGVPALGALFDWLKPRRSVAITRLKNNGFAFVVTLLVTQLAPILPAPCTCLWMLATGGSGMSYGRRLLCWIELAIYTILFMNILQSYIAIRYPPPQSKSSGTPSKQVQLRSPPPSRPLKGFTPTLSRTKASSESPFNTPMSSPSKPSRSQTTQLFNSSPSPFHASMNSSFSASLFSSPLGPRSRQSHVQPVRTLRGSLLSQFEEADDDDEL